MASLPGNQPPTWETHTKFQPSALAWPMVVTAGIWGVNLWIQDCSLSLFVSNKSNRYYLNEVLSWQTCLLADDLHCFQAAPAELGHCDRDT